MLTAPRPSLLTLALLLVATCHPGGPAAQRPVDPAALAHWRSLRFGMFVHWGPVSLTGKEIGWSRGAPTPIGEYDRLPERFNPVHFDPGAWVDLAKATGMRYLVLTTKHHDGFCLWPSAATDHDIDSTPFGRDIVGELATACRQGGIEFGAYYSVPDWYHPDYPKGSPHGRSDKPDAEPDRYAAYLRDQVTELVTNYGPLLTLWFDMPREFGPDHGIPVVNLLRELQPDIVINNRAYTAGSADDITERRPVGDYDTPEQRIGAFQRDRPWETCMTLCRQWSWKPDDQLKSLDECIRILVHTVGGDGNLLLNVGPMPDGRIEPRQETRLRELGAWVERHSAAIHDTRGGPFLPGAYGASTCRGNEVFVFVLAQPVDGVIHLPALDAEVRAVTDLQGAAMPCSHDGEGLSITLGPVEPDRSPTSCIRLLLDRDAFALEPTPVPAEPSGSLAFGRAARASNVFQGNPAYTAAMALDDDAETRWATDSGTRQAWLEIDLGTEREFSRLVLDEPERYTRIRSFVIEVRQNDDWLTVHRGTTVGAGLQIRIEPVTARHLRVRILDATDGPTLREVQVHVE